MEPINKQCPRSGKPVQDDSLAEYRGYVVGFCNTGCRDDFEAHMPDRPDDRRFFDKLIREQNLELRPSPEPARPGELPAIRNLLESCDLPAADLEPELLEHFFLFRENSQPVATIGLEVCGNHGLLRSLAVDHNSRGQGVGNTLVRHLERYARRKGFGTLFLLTTTASSYFAGRGYEEIEREHLPAAIRETEQFTSLCPSTAVAMNKELA